jgi:hypothetical protein
MIVDEVDGALEELESRSTEEKAPLLVKADRFHAAVENLLSQINCAFFVDSVPDDKFIKFLICY